MKSKINEKKIIKVNPLMEKDKTGVEILMVMIIGIFFGMILISFSSCEEKKDINKELPKELSKNSENYSLTVNEYTYQGCEYIVVDFGKEKWGSHKGNCKNKIHNK